MAVRHEPVPEDSELKTLLRSLALVALLLAATASAQVYESLAPGVTRAHFDEAARENAAPSFALYGDLPTPQPADALSVPLTFSKVQGRPAVRVTIAEGTNRLIPPSDPEGMLAAVRETLAATAEPAFAYTSRRPELWDGRAGERIVAELARWFIRREGRRP